MLQSATSPHSEHGGAQLARKVDGSGWLTLQTPATNEAEVRGSLLDVACRLGDPLPGRNGRYVERLVPLRQADALPRSLSAIAGLGAQPWHTDAAHRPIPARYLVLACVDSGKPSVTTELCEWSSLLPAAWIEAARTEPFLVRNGRHSFYATILSQKDSCYRFDPGCMLPTTKQGRELGQIITLGQATKIERINWVLGLIVVIDNWRMLHRRQAAHGAEGRVLLRMCTTKEPHDDPSE